MNRIIRDFLFFCLGLIVASVGLVIWINSPIEPTEIEYTYNHSE